MEAEAPLVSLVSLLREPLLLPQHMPQMHYGIWKVREYMTKQDDTQRCSIYFFEASRDHLQILNKD